jgi:hypothetical protein
VSGILEGQRRVFLGGPAGQVYLLSGNTIDLVDNARGKIRGTATAAGIRSLTDAAATFGDDVDGAPVVIVSGKGVGQIRLVTNHTATKLSLDRPWSIRPDSQSVYQIGGIKWRYRTGWMRWAPAEKENNRRIEILHEPCEGEQRVDVSLYQDRSADPVEWDVTYNPEDLSSLGSEKDSPYLNGDLTNELGFMQRRLDGHKDNYADGPRLFSWQLDGVTNTDQAIVYQLTLDGAIGAREN